MIQGGECLDDSSSESGVNMQEKNLVRVVLWAPDTEEEGEQKLKPKSTIIRALEMDAGFKVVTFDSSLATLSGLSGFMQKNPTSAANAIIVYVHNVDDRTFLSGLQERKVMVPVVVVAGPSLSEGDKQLLRSLTEPRVKGVVHLPSGDHASGVAFGGMVRKAMDPKPTTEGEKESTEVTG